MPSEIVRWAFRRQPAARSPSPRLPPGRLQGTLVWQARTTPLRGVLPRVQTSVRARDSQNGAKRSPRGCDRKCLRWTTTRSAGGGSCFLATEQSWRTAWLARSLLSRTNRSSELSGSLNTRRSTCIMRGHDVTCRSRPARGARCSSSRSPRRAWRSRGRLSTTKPWTCSSATPTRGEPPRTRCAAHTITAGRSSRAAISAAAWSATPRRSSSRWRRPSAPPARSPARRAPCSNGRPAHVGAVRAGRAPGARAAGRRAASRAAVHAARARARRHPHRRPGDAVRQPGGGGGACARPD
jgi:hypothetical protein